MMWDYDSYKDLDDIYIDSFKSKYEQEEALSIWRDSKYNHINDELLKELKKELNDEKSNKKVEISIYIVELITFFILGFVAAFELSLIWFFINMKGLL